MYVFVFRATLFDVEVSVKLFDMNTYLWSVFGICNGNS